MPDTKQKLEWSISDFYTKAWALTKKHRTLWILGLAVSVFAGGGNFDGGGGGSSSDTDYSNEVEEVSAQEPVQLETSDYEYMYDETVTNDTDVMQYDLAMDEEPYAANPVDELSAAASSVAEEYFKDVPMYVYGVLAIEVLAFIIVAVVLYTIAGAWSRASLIKGVSDAEEKDAVSLHEAARHGMNVLRPMVWITVVPALKVFALTLGVILLASVTFTFNSALGAIVLILALIFSLYHVLILIAGYVLGERYVVLKNMSGKDAYEMGVSRSKGKKRRMFSLGFMNAILAFVIMLVIGIPMAIAVGLLTQVDGIDTLFTPTVFIGSLILGGMIAYPLFMLGSAVFTTFITAAWHFAYKVIDSESEVTQS